MTPREARAGGYGIAIPGFGGPDEVYAAEPEGTAYVYRARPGLPPIGATRIEPILTDRPGDVETAYFARNGGSTTNIEVASVNGERGYWVSAGGYADPARTVVLPANVLLWEEEGRALRLESALPQEEAIRAAESVH